MKTFIAITIFLSSLSSQSIMGSWELVSPYTAELGSKDQALIRHHYYADGRFESYMWHDGQFQNSGEGTYTTKQERLYHKVEDETYSGELDFPTDSTMTIQWDGETALLIFKRLPKKPET